MSDGSGQWETQRKHYNAHVKNISTKQALQERRQGPAAPLKSFHNEIKRLLIRRFAFQTASLLDLACGRGGDLHKWRDAQIVFVKGLDIAEAEIKEAGRRFKEMCAKYKSDVGLDAVFEVVDHLGASDWQDDMQYDVVTCMFALHYFFVSEKALLQMMKNVAANLNDGGFFIGTVPDGKRVLYMLDNQPEFKSTMLWLKREWQGAPRVFDCRYICAITDTVTDGHEASVGSSECLVFFNALVTIAAAVGLHPVCNYADQELDACFEEADVSSPFKHFSPNFPNSDASLESASRLNVAFVFQKRSAGAPEALPALPAGSRFGGGGGGGGGGGSGPGPASRPEVSREHQQASKRARTGDLAASGASEHRVAPAAGRTHQPRAGGAHWGGDAAAHGLGGGHGLHQQQRLISSSLAGGGGEPSGGADGDNGVVLSVDPFYVDDPDDVTLLPASERDGAS